MTQYLVEVRQEAKRGCGYRRAGVDGVGIYLVGDAWAEACERLPYPLEVCPSCNGGIKFSRGFTWIRPKALLKGEPLCITERPCLGHNRGHNHLACIVCNPLEEPAGLMWVGEKYYTPASFTAEAMKMGLSKRVSAIPRGFEIGEHWIYLSHVRAKEGKAGIFYVFRPSVVELVINNDDTIPDKAKALKDRLGDKVKIIVVKPVAETQEVAHAV